MRDQYIGQTLADKYRIDSILRDGGGGLGKVYRATHLLMDKPVTIKILAPALAVDENIAGRFSLEARTVSRISHQNILSVTDFGSDASGTTYIVFEGADGDPLKDVIAREGKLPFERAVRIARQIASALSAAHAHAIIHRGLTSENILLARSASGAEIVKVLDFGIAATENGLADDENSAGKLEYLSPEQNASLAEADERSDVYSLGVIFYEMLAGAVPFTADNATDLLMKQANNPPAPLSSFRGDLPPTVEPVILRALAKNPEMRYQNAAEFTNDLNATSINSGETETVIIPNSALQTDHNVRNNMWKTAFVVLAGISLLAISFIYATSSKQTNSATTLQTDMNGQPVQPLNPATGISEQGASALTPFSPEILANANMYAPQMPQTMPNGNDFGDGYNPWARGVPPAGAPVGYPPIPPGGVIIDPTTGESIFMPNDANTIIVRVPVNANTSANMKPTATPTGKPTPAPANTAPQPTPTAETKPTPVKPPTPAPKPTTQPAKTPPAAAPEKRAQSGEKQDS